MRIYPKDRDRGEGATGPRKRGFALTLPCLAQLMVVLDLAIVNVA